MDDIKQSLPPYIVNCFYEAGYDSLDAIIEMNDDSISEIEQYIDERKSDLPHCMRDATDEKSSRSFKFPPGHKIRIRKFIMKHKDLFSPQKPMKSEIVHQKSSNRRDVATQPKSKKQKLSCEDIPTTTEDIRRKIVKWTKRYENEETGRTVAEGQDFVIQVKKSLTDSSLCHATIECRCGNSYVVTRNPKGEHQITNWSRHFKTCISEKSKKRSSQQTLKMFVKANQPPPAKDMLRPSLHDLESLVALSAETLRSTKANPSPGTQYQQSTQDSFSHSDSPSPLPQPILPSNNTSSTAASMQMDQLSTDESCLESLSVLSGLTTAGNTGTCTLQQQLSHLEPLQPIDIVQETPQQHLSHDMELTKSSLVPPSLSPLTTPLPQLQVPAVASPPITTNFKTAASTTGSNHTETHNILSSHKEVFH